MSHLHMRFAWVEFLTATTSDLRAVTGSAGPRGGHLAGCRSAGHNATVTR
jgi:hypothetical protein